MNHLSKLLYWGDVFGHLGPTIGIFGLLFCVISIILLICYFSEGMDDPAKVVVKKLGFRFATASFFCIAVSVITPSKETVYAIAASEVGEQILKSPIVGKAEKALETWLDKQINAKE